MPPPNASKSREQTIPETHYIYAEPLIPAAIKTLKAMRKWNCSFKGSKLYEFLERAEKL